LRGGIRWREDTAGGDEVAGYLCHRLVAVVGHLGEHMQSGVVVNTETPHQDALGLSDEIAQGEAMGELAVAADGVERDPGNEREATPTRASAPITGSLQATPYRITIEGLGYTNLTVPARALISVVNKDDVKHTVTPDAQGVFDVGVPPHAEAQFHAPATPGDYAYHCTYHPAMFAVLTVT
jgi:plastocyanin